MMVEVDLKESQELTIGLVLHVDLHVIFLETLNVSNVKSLDLPVRICTV